MSGGRIVATERSDDSLREVQALGADTVVNTAVSDNELAEAFTAARGAGYDIVLDYLWGRPTEVLLRTLVPLLSRSRSRPGTPGDSAAWLSQPPPTD